MCGQLETSVFPRGGPVGKSAGRKLDGGQGESTEEPKTEREASKKRSLRVLGNRTKTDTGGWDEYSQAREITLVKELCKLPS